MCYRTQTILTCGEAVSEADQTDWQNRDPSRVEAILTCAEALSEAGQNTPQFATPQAPAPWDLARVTPIDGALGGCLCRRHHGRDFIN